MRETEAGDLFRSRTQSRTLRAVPANRRRDDPLPMLAYGASPRGMRNDLLQPFAIPSSIGQNGEHGADGLREESRKDTRSVCIARDERRVKRAKAHRLCECQRVLRRSTVIMHETERVAPILPIQRRADRA